MKRQQLHAGRGFSQAGYGVISMVINLIFGIILTLVALRLVLMLLAANASNGFVNWVYSVSQPLVAPFAGIFQDATLLSGRLEVATIVALIIYGIVASVLGMVADAGGRRWHSV